MPFDDAPRVSQHLWEWLAKLHTLTAGASSPDEAAARIELVAGMVAQRFPDTLLTDAALEHVAAKCRFWPAYGELAAALREFRDTYVHTPRLALPGPRVEGRAPPDAAEVQHVSAAIAGLMRDLEADRQAREAMEPPGPALRPLADVMAKGEVLDRIRASGKRVAA